MVSLWPVTYSAPSWLISLAFLFVSMDIMILFFTICSCRINVVFVTLFASLFMVFACLSGAYWRLGLGDTTIGIRLTIVRILTLWSNKFCFWLTIWIGRRSFPFCFQYNGVVSAVRSAAGFCWISSDFASWRSHSVLESLKSKWCCRIRWMARVTQFCVLATVACSCCLSWCLNEVFALMVVWCFLAYAPRLFCINLLVFWHTYLII